VYGGPHKCKRATVRSLAAQFGRGIFLDHAFGFVAGETVVVEDDASMFHGVTLGGSGTENGKRHLAVRTAVLIGAGAEEGPMSLSLMSFDILPWERTGRPHFRLRFSRRFASWPRRKSERVMLVFRKA